MKLRKWLKSDDEILKENTSRSIKELSELLNRSTPSIKNRKKKLGLTLNFNWSDDENRIMVNNYTNSHKDVLLDLLPGRSWQAITHHAQELGLSRIEYYHNSKRLSSLKKLLEESNESYYYMGLLMADGYFTNNKITLSQSLKSKKLVYNFAKFINCNNINVNDKIEEVFIMGNKTVQNGRVTLIIKDSIVIPKILNKFNIIYVKNEKTKTYYPPSVNIFKNMSDNNFISFLIGFIDGDGSITKKINGGNSIILGIHINWLENIEYIKLRIEKILNLKLSKKAIVVKNNEVRLSIYNSKIINIFKGFIKKNKLTVNEIKWNRI